MAFDGLAERAAVFALLGPIVNGRAHRGIPEDEILERDATGNVKPYIVAKFGRPVPTAGDRGMALGEDEQPHIMAMTIVAYAWNQLDAETLAAAITRALTNFQPNAESSRLKGAGGYSYTAMGTANKPSRYAETCGFTTVINQ